MAYNGTDGSVLQVTQTFLDEQDFPLSVKAGYPQVRLVDGDKQLLSSVTASPTVNPGEWTANVSIPNLSLESRTELRINWRIRCTDGSRVTHSDVALVEPKVETRISDIVGVFGDASVSFTLPTRVTESDVATYQVYGSNTPVSELPLNLLSEPHVSSVDKTTFTIPFALPSPSLAAYLLRVIVEPYDPSGTKYPRTYTYKMWAITPQVLLAMSHLEAFLDKSRIAQVIPELRYTPGDLVTYLERGLYLFNMLGVTTTAFTGLNMQGVLFDALVTCGSYYALGAQLMAEGSLAFDFSGQSISLNVDRTPQLESALGRIESVISDKLVPLKKQLTAQGILSGDGSIGKGNLNNPSRLGTLGLINAATTRINGGRGGGFFGGVGLR